MIEFKTKSLTLNFSAFDINLTVVENLDELFDDLIKKGTTHPDFVDERMPYWADLWASAIGMSRYLIDNQRLVDGKAVLEIGCGLGLPAIVAGKLGAASVMLTDYLAEAVAFAKLNWQQNLPSGNVQFSTLDWRQDTPSRQNQDFSDAQQYQADILLASDVAYERRAFEPLLGAFKTFIKPDGCILIAEPNRDVSKHFFQNLEAEGFAVRQTTLTVERRGFPFRVNVFKLKRETAD